MTLFLRKYGLAVFAGLFCVLLLLKYFWTFFAFPGVPFGYDAGIYRTLFLRHAEAWPPFSLAPLPEWAKAHPLGLFFFSSLLLKLGIPVDWLIGWVWNLFPVILAITLALTMRRTRGTAFALSILLVALLSVVQFEGFTMIYWKVFAAFFWCPLAFDAYERRSWTLAPFGMLTIATHQQIGLLFVLAIVSSLVASWLKHEGKDHRRTIGFFVLSLVLGGLWYIPNYRRSIADVLPLLFSSHVLIGAVIAAAVLASVALLLVSARTHRQKFARLAFVLLIGVPLLVLPLIGTAPQLLDRFSASFGQSSPGAFLSVHEYLWLSWPLLTLGLTGLGFSLRRTSSSPWQWAALWSGLAVISLAFFYRRFLLPLDFFLLPFAAEAVLRFWKYRSSVVLSALVILLILQAGLTLQRVLAADPHVSAAELRAFRELPNAVPLGSTVIVLDNMAPWVVGFLPHASVSGPGIFDSRPYADWQNFLLGNDADRRAFISAYPKGTFFYATDVFRSYYPASVLTLLQHPCLQKTGVEGLYRSVCGS